jgi:hypothetical protein
MSFSSLLLFSSFGHIKHLLGKGPNECTCENAYELAICSPKFFELIFNTLGGITVTVKFIGFVKKSTVGYIFAISNSGSNTPLSGAV